MSEPSHRQTRGDPVDILLVEDNPGDVRLIEESFETTARETRFRVIDNGEDAIDFVTREDADRSAPLPDLALVDLNLPKRDGCDVLEAIREDPQAQNLPVLMLTSSGATEDIERCYRARANAYLTKPTDPDELTAIAEAVERFWFEQAQLPPALP